ncbi:hypothetical protein [Cellulomonas gilvus]|uniref:Activator of Hsp90 ATPase 1 family protein n=1 Tax=Cellulomonas gilvus (strain ATCC 13127 / NRRL B-14078) TaxID=593907 RepID=F8A6K3_CELGA|nr:hypothetical protein [Cellulomonas gilvus]AEI13491.1 hypothetical protein Celgi_2999 [Cellulomonas gilvus ATCC 13127]
MGRYVGTVGRPLDEVRWAIDAVAPQQGWTLGFGSTREVAVLTKGMTLWSWGATLHVHLQDLGGITRLTCDTREELPALTDWGRGKRAAQRLVEALGGTFA